MTGPDGVTDRSATDARAVRHHVESYLAEDDVLLAARDGATTLGATPVGPGAGAGLRFLAAAISARAVVEIGTGAGVSGLWLLRGMARDGVLTSIDVDPEHQRIARLAFTAAGHGPSRLRLINGMGLDVLPRLTDGGYDLVFVDAQPVDYPRYLDEAVRLLRPGGIVALDDALSPGVVPAGVADVRAGVVDAGAPEDDVAEPAPVTPGVLALREVARQVREDERLVPVLLPLGDGLLAAVKIG